MPRKRPDGPQLKLHKGVWYIAWWDGGRRRRLSTGTENEHRARQSLVDFQERLSQRVASVDVASALDRYALMKTGKVMAQGRLDDVVKALKAPLGYLRLDQVTQDLWDLYCRQRVTRPPRHSKPGQHEPRPVSTGTLRREFNVLRAALRQAWKDGHIDKPPSLTAPADSAPRDRYLTKVEARALLAAATTLHVRVFVALAIFTGARKGSILSLTWSRVDFATGMIDFQEPGRRITGKRRSIVPMNTQLRAELQLAHQARQTAYVVEYNGKPVPSGLRWSFNKLCEKAGLSWRPTPHHLKHSVASWFAMEGVSIDQAADWLATDPKTLQRTYRKFDPTYLRSAASALDL